MPVRILRAERAHAEAIASRLRAASPEQVELMGMDCVGVIAATIERARLAWTGFWDEEIACIVGVESTTLVSDTAYLWIITTEVVEKHPFVFARWSQMFVRALISERYECICGCVDPRFHRSVVWLKWLGFEIRPLDGFPELRRFEMRRAA